MGGDSDMACLRKFTYVVVFISLFVLFGCGKSEHEDKNVTGVNERWKGKEINEIQNDIMIKVDEKWRSKTINKVMSGYNMESEFFIDYNDKSVKLSIDEIWRSIEMYNLIGYSFDEQLLLKSFSNITPGNIREKLEYDYICTLLGEKECKVFYSDYNVLVEELFNISINNDNDEVYEILDAFYILITNFSNKLNESSKSRIVSWISENKETFQDDIGLLYSILEIEYNLNEEFITIKNKDKYKQLLTDALNREGSDLAEIYYLYFINVYLQNSHDKESIAIKTAEYYNKEYGFSLSTNEYVDGNLGSYLGVKILSSLGKINLLQADMLELFKNNEDTYGGFVNKENILTGSVEETIMANYTLEKLNKKQKTTIENIDLNNLNWYWTYYGLLQYGNEITVESKEFLLKNLEMFESEILNTDFSDEVYKQLLTSSGIINEVEYFSKVGMLLDYPFKEEYKIKLEEISTELINMITRKEVSVLSSIVSLNDIFELNLDEKDIEFIITEAINKNDRDNFYEWYSVIKAAGIIGIFKKENLDLYKFLNSNGGVYGDLNNESSGALFSTFLMLSLVEVTE